MILNKLIPSLLGLVVGAALTASAVPVVETIPGIVVEKGAPVGFKFKSEFDPESVAVLKFSGAALLRGVRLEAGSALTAFPIIPIPIPSEILSIKFDWIGLDGTEQFSPVFPIRMLPDVLTEIELAYRIPFCPRGVSIHFETDGQFPIVLKGLFVHECLPRRVPDGSMAGMPGVLLALAGCHWGVRRKMQRP